MTHTTHTELLARKCSPLPPGAPRLSPEQVSPLLQELDGWQVVDHAIQKQFSTSTYLAGIRWVDQVALIAESEDHHPDIYVSWCKITVTLWTHTVQGLSINDFIVAAKLDDAWRRFVSSGESAA
jgi:4a-hydroxytetrahydrobiopterin dehydratase